LNTGSSRDFLRLFDGWKTPGAEYIHAVKSRQFASEHM